MLSEPHWCGASNEREPRAFVSSRATPYAGEKTKFTFGAAEAV
jgi:hypothetical protein